MKYHVIIGLSLIMLNAGTGCYGNKKVALRSPDGRNELTIITAMKEGGRIMPAFSLNTDNKQVIIPSPVRISADGVSDIYDLKILSVRRESFSNTWINNFGERKEVPDNYNQAIIALGNEKISINLICRAYNE